LAGIAGLLESLGDQVIVGLSILAGRLIALALLGADLAAVLETAGSDQSLDLGSLGGWLLSILGDLSSHNVLSYIILLAEVKQSEDLGGSLGAQSDGSVLVGQTLNLLIALLNDDQVEDREISANNAAANGFSLALSSLAWAI